uniref:GAG-pre-integrase domain-containing protein n=1 Tax=Triticum urartu TaxID=4572 RepID=A0A8R7PCV6_TRIUA
KDQVTRRVLLQGRSHSGLYSVPSSHVSSSFGQSSRHVLSVVKLTFDHWHKRLGHPSSSIVDSVIRLNKLACAPSRESLVCDACQRGKVHQLPYNNSSHVTNSPLELVHTDVWG